MMIAHTPGPWDVLPPDTHRPSRATVVALRGATIYDAPLTEETAANARLIAAAPELLAAVIDLAGSFEFCLNDDCTGVCQDCERRRAAKALLVRIGAV